MCINKETSQHPYYVGTVIILTLQMKTLEDRAVTCAKYIKKWNGRARIQIPVVSARGHELSHALCLSSGELFIEEVFVEHLFCTLRYTLLLMYFTAKLHNHESAP